MVKSNHTFTLKGLAHTSTVVESLGDGEGYDPTEGIVFVERITETSRKRLFATAPRLNTTNTQYEYSILETLEDLTVPELIKQGASTPTFYVRKDLTRLLLNSPTGGESQSEFLGKNLVRGLCERFYEDIKHDIMPYLFNVNTGLFEDIQPLVFTLTTTTDSVTVNILDSAVLANVETSIDGGVTWSSDLAYSALASGDYTILVKEREEIILSQDFTIV